MPVDVIHRQTGCAKANWEGWSSLSFEAKAFFIVDKWDRKHPTKRRRYKSGMCLVRLAKIISLPAKNIGFARKHIFTAENIFLILWIETSWNRGFDIERFEFSILILPIDDRCVWHDVTCCCQRKTSISRATVGNVYFEPFELKYRECSFRCWKEQQSIWIFDFNSANWTVM